MAEVECDAFKSGILLAFLVSAAQTVCLLQFRSGLSVITLVVVDYTHLVQNHRVCFIQFVCLLELQQCGFVVVHSHVLHTDVETGVVAAWEQTCSGAVCCHRRVRLVLRRVGMSEGNPTRREVLIQLVCLAEVLSRQIKLLDQVVVATLKK